jgi:hypothetical protein
MYRKPYPVPTTGFVAPVLALIHLSERWSIVEISTLRYSRGPPTYSHSLNGARTLHCFSRAGDQGSVDHAMHANIGLMVSYRPIRGLAPQPELDRECACLPNRSQIDAVLCLGQPIESVHVHVFVVVWIIYMHCIVSGEENMNS